MSDPNPYADDSYKWGPPQPPGNPPTMPDGQGYGYPAPGGTPAYGYPQPAGTAAAAGYGYPPPATAPGPASEVRLPPQGPQFIGR